MKTFLSTLALVAASSAAFASNPPASPLLTDIANNRAAIEAEITALQGWADTYSSDHLCVPWGELAGACSNTSEIYGFTIDFATLDIAVVEGANVIAPLPSVALNETFETYQAAKAAKDEAYTTIDEAYDFGNFFSVLNLVNQVGLADTSVPGSWDTIGSGILVSPDIYESFSDIPIRFFTTEITDLYYTQLGLLEDIAEAISEGDDARLMELRVEFKGNLGVGVWEALPSGNGFGEELAVYQGYGTIVSNHISEREQLPALVDAYQDATVVLAQATINYVAAAEAAGVEPQL